MKKLLMIAYAFPPVGGISAAGSQRVVRFAKYLPLYGWQPVILTVAEASYESYLSMDPGLVEKVPPGMTVVRTRVIRGLTPLLEIKKAVGSLFHGSRLAPAAIAGVGPSARDRDRGGWYQRLKDTITDLFEIPDEAVGWLVPGVAAGLRTIRRENADVIFSTGRPWTAHLIGLVLKRLTGKPLVVEFRDPWMTNPFRPAHSFVKNRLEASLERQVVERADLIVANTDHLREEFIKRFSDRIEAKCITIANGFDPDDYAGLKYRRGNGDGRKYFGLVHTGFLYGRRDPRRLLEAIKLLRETRGLSDQTLRIGFVGSIELPYDLTQYLRANRLNEIVTLYGHVPYAKTLEHLAGCDVALLLQPGTDTQIPSKVFEYIGMKKPILAIGKKGGAVAELVATERLGEVADAEDVQEIAEAVYRMYERWSEGGEVWAGGAEVHTKFDVRQLAGVMARELARVAAK